MWMNDYTTACVAKPYVQGEWWQCQNGSNRWCMYITSSLFRCKSVSICMYKVSTASDKSIDSGLLAIFIRETCTFGTEPWCRLSSWHTCDLAFQQPPVLLLPSDPLVGLLLIPSRHSSLLLQSQPLLVGFRYLQLTAGTKIPGASLNKRNYTSKARCTCIYLDEHEPWITSRTYLQYIAQKTQLQAVLFRETLWRIPKVMPNASLP